MYEVYLNFNGSYVQFLKSIANFVTLNADCGVNRDGHMGQNFGMYGTVLPKGICIANIKGISQLVWEL